MSVRVSNPPEVGAPVGPYSHIAEAPDGARVVALSGQVGLRADGSAPASLEDQFDVALGNIRALISAARATPTDVLKVTLYLTERLADLARFRSAVAEAFPNAPAMTLVYVAGLVRPDLKVEIDVTLAPVATP